MHTEIDSVAAAINAALLFFGSRITMTMRSNDYPTKTATAGDARNE
jgi:hypothetical protein